MNSLSVALRYGYLSVRTAEGASEKQSSLKARLRNGLTYLLTYLLTYTVTVVHILIDIQFCIRVGFYITVHRVVRNVYM